MSEQTSYTRFGIGLAVVLIPFNCFFEPADRHAQDPPRFNNEAKAD